MLSEPLRHGEDLECRLCLVGENEGGNGRPEVGLVEVPGLYVRGGPLLPALQNHNSDPAKPLFLGLYSRVEAHLRPVKHQRVHRPILADYLQAVGSVERKI